MDWVNRLTDVNYDNILYLFDGFAPYTIRAIAPFPIGFSGPSDAYFFTTSLLAFKETPQLQASAQPPSTSTPFEGPQYDSLDPRSSCRDVCAW